MELFDELVNEAMFEEGANKDWRDFLKKYDGMADDHTYFVQFTEYGSSTDDKRFVGSAEGKEAPNKIGSHHSKYGVIGMYIRDKKSRKRADPDMTLWTTPNHKDPLAIYVYPLWYVLQDPHHIPYGKDARFMRVIHAKPGVKKLDLQSITSRVQAMDLARKMGAFKIEGKDADQDVEREIYNAAYERVDRRMYDEKKKNPSPAQIFFFLAQNEVGFQKTMVGSRIEFYLLSNKQQSDRLRKIGIQLVTDTAHEKSDAVIHPNEPIQGFFLDRSAFEIADVYEIRRERKSGNYIDKESNFSFHLFEGRLASTIADRLGDKIVSKGDVHGGVHAGQDEDAEGYTHTAQETVWKTKRGRAIAIASQFTGGGDEERKRSVPVTSRVEMRGEHGTVQDVFKPEESMQDFVRRFLAKYDSQPIDPNWKPVRGENRADQLWRDTLQSFTQKLDGISPKIASRKANQHGSSKIHLKNAFTFADAAMDNLVELLKQHGWEWVPPTDKWEKLAAWIIADEFFKQVNKLPAKIHTANAYDKSRAKTMLITIADKYLKVDSGGWGHKDIEEARKLWPNDSEKLKVVRLAYIIVNHELFDYQPVWYNKLINGLTFAFEKDPKMQENGFPNFDKSLHHEMAGMDDGFGVKLSDGLIHPSKYKNPFGEPKNKQSPMLPPGYKVEERDGEFVVIDLHDDTFAGGMVVDRAKTMEEAAKRAKEHYEEKKEEASAS